MGQEFVGLHAVESRHWISLEIITESVRQQVLKDVCPRKQARDWGSSGRGATQDTVLQNRAPLLPGVALEGRSHGGTPA